MTEPRFDVTVLGGALVDIVRTPAGAAESPGGSPADMVIVDTVGAGDASSTPGRR